MAEDSSTPAPLSNQEKNYVSALLLLHFDHPTNSEEIQTNVSEQTDMQICTNQPLMEIELQVNSPAVPLKF